MCTSPCTHVALPLLCAEKTTCIKTRRIELTATRLTGHDQAAQLLTIELAVTRLADYDQAVQLLTVRNIEPPMTRLGGLCLINCTVSG